MFLNKKAIEQKKKWQIEQLKMIKAFYKNPDDDKELPGWLRDNAIEGYLDELIESVKDDNPLGYDPEGYDFTDYLPEGNN